MYQSIPSDIRERFDRELLVNTYWQSNMMLLIKRANKWFPMIEKILNEEGIPNDFKYLAVVESGLDKIYVHQKRCKGILAIDAFYRKRIWFRGKQ